MQKKQVSFIEVDSLVGIEVLYNSKELSAITKNAGKNPHTAINADEPPIIPVYYKQPTPDELKLLPNGGQTFINRRLVQDPTNTLNTTGSVQQLDYNTGQDNKQYLSYLIVFGLIQQQTDGTIVAIDIDSIKLTFIINWFARFPDLACVTSHQQNWYKATLTKFLDSYKNWNQTTYFKIMADLAYCIQRGQNPRLIARLIEAFKDILNHETQRLVQRSKLP